jgi:hypothetical protein
MTAFPHRLSPRWLPALLAATLGLSGCAALLQREEAAQAQAPATPSPSPTSAPQVPTVTPVPMRPLPGGLDATLVFNSNSPEIVQTPGVLLSTRRPANARERDVYLDQVFSGTFQVFSHHIAKDETPGARLLYLGLLAENRGTRRVTLDLVRGASYLSQPEALFVPLPPLLDDPTGKVYAGPGDRVAGDWLHGRSSVKPQRFTLAPGETALVYSLPIPTDVAILPPINGRTTQLELRSDGPISLSEVARFADKGPAGFVAPRPADYAATLAEKTLAGPRDLAPTAYDPTQPVPKGRFVYGRVAGVSEGATWRGTLEAPAPGAVVGYPIATAFLNRLGTNQVQSAPMRRRYADTAYQGHGNYGVTYALSVPLANPGPQARTFTFTLSHPARVAGSGATAQMTYMDPPNRPVMFRGPIRVEWRDAQGRAQTRYPHVVLQHGHAMPPFATIAVPAGATTQATLTLLYPADATPPQLLTIESR